MVVAADVSVLLPPVLPLMVLAIEKVAAVGAVQQTGKQTHFPVAGRAAGISVILFFFGPSFDPKLHYNPDEAAQFLWWFFLYISGIPCCAFLLKEERTN